jgi:putative transposase
MSEIGGGTASPFSADDGDIVPPKNTDTKNGGTASPLSTDDGKIALPSNKHEYPNRNHPAHHPPIARHNRTAIIFLTVCTHKRRRILDNDAMHEALKTAWRNADDWIIGRYIIMPDHIHLFCSPATNESVKVVQWTSYWKRLVSQQLPNLQPIWQRDCWDTQLRGHESYSEKWEYVANNPVRAGLVEDSGDWLFQGTINHLPW